MLLHINHDIKQIVNIQYANHARHIYLIVKSGQIYLYHLDHAFVVVNQAAIGVNSPQQVEELQYPPSEKVFDINSIKHMIINPAKKFKNYQQDHSLEIQQCITSRLANKLFIVLIITTSHLILLDQNYLINL